MDQEPKKTEFLIVDEMGDDPLVRVVQENDPGGDILSLRFVESIPEPPDLMQHQEICLVNVDEELVVRCEPLRQTHTRITVRRSTATVVKFDRDLRAPARFSSFIYPVSGDWKGRWEVRGIDLSCGGIAFSCGAELCQQEIVELALPIAHQPLLVQCRILHSQLLDETHFIYSDKFVALCREEEAMIRRAVFDLQLQNRRKKSTKQETR